jgi:hypothetical protein
MRREKETDVGCVKGLYALREPTALFLAVD